MLAWCIANSTVSDVSQAWIERSLCILQIFTCHKCPVTALQVFIHISTASLVHRTASPDFCAIECLGSKTRQRTAWNQSATALLQAVVLNRQLLRNFSRWIVLLASSVLRMRMRPDWDYPVSDWSSIEGRDWTSSLGWGVHMLPPASLLTRGCELSGVIVTR